MNPTFSFQSEVELMEGTKASWVYTTVPIDESEIIADFVPERRGFGSVRVQVRLETEEWRTSIFPMKEGTFFLPLKAAVRKKADVDVGDTIEVEIDILIED